MISTPLKKEISSRRTFAVVAHPDTGRTTLAEKLLPYGGAIHVAGAVKSSKIKKSTTSNPMEIERQRGIFVATNVMGFNYKDYKINILDTPDHQDFVEDAYRMLTAVDSIIITIDHAKGVEQQTRCLMEVCRIRHTPVIVFINRLDREGLDPSDLLDEVEQEFGIVTTPMIWLIGTGDRFKGVYNIFDRKLNLSTPNKQHAVKDIHHIESLDSPDLVQHIGAVVAKRPVEEIEMVEDVYPKFDHDAYPAGEQAPAFFGSALNTFGMRKLLDIFVCITPSPQPAQAEKREIGPYEENFTGFVFKIRANMDPNRRNCTVLVKVRSECFERNAYYRYTHLDKRVRFPFPTALMVNKKGVIDDAYAGDTIGLPDTGLSRIGDTLTSGEVLYLEGLPSFSPEYFKHIESTDPMKQKQFTKSIDQLMGEGVAQLLINQLNSRRVIDTVDQFQFEVIQYRLLHECGAECRQEPLYLYRACWVESDDVRELANFRRRRTQYMVLDSTGRNAYLAENNYILQMAQQDFPHVRFHLTSEF